MLLQPPLVAYGNNTRLFELHSELITVRFNCTNCNLQIVRKLACFPPFTLCYKWMLHRIDGKKQRMVLNVGVACYTWILSDIYREYRIRFCDG